MNKKKLSSLQAANLEFVEEPMDDYYTNLLLGIPSRWRVKRILDEIGALENKKILDVGCEAGYVSIEMAKKGAEVLAIDFINEPLQLFKEKLEKFPELKKNIKIRQADARKIPVKSNFFDVIVATEVIEHMPQVLKFAKEAQRVAKKNGKIIITFPNENLRKKIYPVVKFLGINTDIESEVTLYSYQLKDILKVFKKYFKLIKNYSLPPFFPITRIMIFSKIK